MIPKIAHFYYTPAGRPPPIRRASWETFARLNPSWEIRRYGYHVGLDNLRKIVLDSDVTRYRLLATAGGFYFDTDIIFRRPIPDEWLEHDNACILHPSGAPRGIAALGGRPESRLWGNVWEAAQRRTQSPVVLGMQSLGIDLLLTTDLRALAARHGEDIFPIPFESLFPVDWHSIPLLWSPGYPPLKDEIGVHWFGGDRLSQEFEAMDKLPDCLVRAALEEAAV